MRKLLPILLLSVLNTLPIYANIRPIARPLPNHAAFEYDLFTHRLVQRERTVFATMPPQEGSQILSFVYNAANQALQVYCVGGTCSGGGGGGGTSSAFGAAFPANGTAIGVSDGTNMVALILGQHLAAASVPVVLTAAQLSTLTPLTTVAVTQGTSPWVVSLTSTTITGSVAVTGTFWPYSLGQQLAAASVPVVLTAAQITTLTPPGAITNYALETGGNLATVVTNTGTIAGAISSAIMQGNVKQINGITPLMGNGGTGTGSQRVTVASDNSALPAWGHGATGAAVPAGATYIGGIGTGNLTGALICDTPFLYDTNTNGKTQLIALSSGKIVYVCSLSVSQSTTTTVSVSLGSGTGSNCGSTYTAKTPAWPIQSGTSVGPAGLDLTASFGSYLFKTAASEELCVSTTAGVSVQLMGMSTQQ